MKAAGSKETLKDGLGPAPPAARFGGDHKRAAMRDLVATSAKIAQLAQAGLHAHTSEETRNLVNTQMHEHTHTYALTHRNARAYTRAHTRTG